MILHGLQNGEFVMARPPPLSVIPARPSPYPAIPAKAGIWLQFILNEIPACAGMTKMGGAGMTDSGRVPE